MRPDADTARIETALTRHPRFGDSVLIKSVADSRFQLILQAAGAGRNTSAHPVVRKAAEDYLRAIGGDEREAARRLREVADLARDHESGTLRMVGQGHDRLDEMLTDTLDGLLKGASEVTGELAGDDTGENFRRGCALLEELLPELGGGVPAHVGAIAGVRASSAMGSVLAAACGDGLPGTLIFDPDQLANPWEAAGHILHEALHLKFFDISRGGALLEDPTAPLHVPWRHQEWDVRRAFVSLHVYAHMVLFQAVADARSDELAPAYGPRPNRRLALGRGVSDTHETAAGRANHLARRLLGDLAPCLTGEGRELLIWLLKAVDPLLDQAPPQEAPTGAAPRPRAAGRYTKNDDLLAKPCVAAGRLILLNRRTGDLHFLNLPTWLAFELCDGESGIDERYSEMLSGKVGPGGSAQLLDRALEQLSRNDLVTADTTGGDR